MSGGLQPGFSERKPSVVEIDEVGPVIVDDPVLAKQPFSNEIGVERRRSSSSHCPSRLSCHSIIA